MRTINQIIIHCTATKENQDVTAKQVDTWHRQRGWSGIGYHYLVRLDGTIEAGRPLEQVGAHTLGRNKNSIGVCYAGGLDSKGNSKDTRTDQQKDALINLLSDLKERFPSATIHGHREYSNKDCPCFDAKEEYKDIGTVRTSPTQSTTVQASAVTIASGIGTGIGAVGNLDGTAQLILIGFACTIILAGMWILRERLRKWANGDR